MFSKRLLVVLFKASIAWRNLFHQRSQFITALTAIMFVVFLIFAQLGFRNALASTSPAFIKHLDADLILRHSGRYVSNVELTFDLHRLNQARGLAVVQSAYPLYITLGNWRASGIRKEYPIRIFAFNPDHPVFRLPQVRATQAILKLPNTVLTDTQSRQIYGALRPGTTAELSGKRIEVVGTFPLGATFIADGNLIMSDQTFLNLFANQASGFEGQVRSSLQQVDMGVLKLTPGADIEQTVQALKALLPPDVLVKPKQQVLNEEAQFWIRSTAIGFVFELGVIVAFGVGIIMVYHIIYTNIDANTPQYATLRAIGHSQVYLWQIVFLQSLTVAIAGFIPGLCLSSLLYQFTTQMTGLVMEMTPVGVQFVFGLTVVMCLISGLIAAGKLQRLDPASVYSQKV